MARGIKEIKKTMRPPRLLSRGFWRRSFLDAENSLKTWSSLTRELFNFTILCVREATPPLKVEFPEACST